MRNIDGIGLAALFAGSIITYAGIKGISVPHALQSVVQGQKPSGLDQPVSGGTVTVTSPAGGTITSSGGQPAGSDAANQALGRVLAAGYGWGTGDEWTALNNIAMAESGWSDTVTNPSSGAAGIAQRISGFGPGYESGNARQQITWMLQYIKQRYGDPIAAWQFHEQNGFY